MQQLSWKVREKSGIVTHIINIFNFNTETKIHKMTISPDVITKVGSQSNLKKIV